MEIHVKTDSSDKRLLWIGLAVVGIVLAWNVGHGLRLVELPGMMVLGVSDAVIRTPTR